MGDECVLLSWEWPNALTLTQLPCLWLGVGVRGLFPDLSTIELQQRNKLGDAQEGIVTLVRMSTATLLRRGSVPSSE